VATSFINAVKAFKQKKDQAAFTWRAARSSGRTHV